MTTNGSNGMGPADEPVGPFRVLDTAIRRRAGIVYLVGAGLVGLLILATGMSVLWLTVVAPLLVFAVFQFVAGWKMKITDMEAIAIASEATTFEVGHASGSLGFRGAFAKPVWQILAYGSGPAPTQQAVVTVDALSGEVRGVYEEDVETA